MEKQDSSVKNDIRLSARLAALANMVTAGNRLADIGTDHGYIPIYLCRSGRIPSAIAMDVREGPLSRAESHIREYGLTDRIQPRLSDGLEKLGEDEAETVLIAGMGGRLMLRILSETVIPDSVTEFVLQPQTDIYLIRRWVREHGFQIADEDMIEEDGKYYPMMRAERIAEPAAYIVTNAAIVEPKEGTVAEQDADMLTNVDLYAGEHRNELDDNFGPILLAKRHPVLQRWLEKELKTTETILSQLEKNSEENKCSSRSGANIDDAGDTDETANSRIISRRRELLHRKEMLLTALKYYR